MIHDLKCWPEYFDAVASGAKTFEFRVNDRDFKVGDTLHLRRFDSETMQYTGEEVNKTVTYVLSTRQFAKCGDGANFVIMGLAPRDWTPCAEALPDTNDDVYITYEYRGKLIAAVGFMGHSGAWYILEDDDGNVAKVNAIAWQPLPAAWKEPENV